MIEWNTDMTKVPKDGTPVLVWLEKPLHHCYCVGAYFRPNVTIVGGLFSFDAPKPIAWALPNPPENFQCPTNPS